MTIKRLDRLEVLVYQLHTYDGTSKENLNKDNWILHPVVYCNSC